MNNLNISDAESAMIHSTPSAEDSEEALELLKEAFNTLEYGHEIRVNESWVQKVIVILNRFYRFDEEKQRYT